MLASMLDSSKSEDFGVQLRMSPSGSWVAIVEATRAMGDMKDLQRKTKVECPNLEFMDLREHMQSEFRNLFFYDLETANRCGNCPAASDILRYELLKKYGGVYMDVDIAVKEAFGDLYCQHEYALYYLAESEEKPPTNSDITSYFYFINALIACHPESVIMKSCIDKIRNNYKTLNSGVKHSIHAMIKSMFDTKRNYYCPNKFTIETTGPNMLREEVYLQFACRGAGGQNTIKINDYIKDKTLKQDQGFKSFWEWVEENCRFPDEKINFDTEEQKQSATKELVQKVGIGKANDPQSWRGIHG